MSYEGYNQNLCNNGHYYTSDAYFQNKHCPHCLEVTVWVNAVDQTNGPPEGEISVESLKKFLLQAEVVQTCSLGHKHISNIARYRIPSKEETETMRFYYGS